MESMNIKEKMVPANPVSTERCIKLRPESGLDV